MLSFCNINSGEAPGISPPSLPLLVFINFLWLHYSSWHWTESFSLSLFFFFNLAQYSTRGRVLDMIMFLMVSWNILLPFILVCAGLYLALCGDQMSIWWQEDMTILTMWGCGMVSMKKIALVAYIFKMIRWRFDFKNCKRKKKGYFVLG